MGLACRTVWVSNFHGERDTHTNVSVGVCLKQQLKLFFLSDIKTINKATIFAKRKKKQKKSC